MPRLLLLSVLCTLFPRLAGGAPAPPAGLKIGDCVLFREGGAGLIFRTPVYWLRGRVVEVEQRQRLASHCPRIGKPLIAYTPADHARLAAAAPCVNEDSEPVVVAVTRVQVAVEDWETPWSPQQGTTGWLFRGSFLDQTLEKGKVIDMAAHWLTACEASE